MSWCLFLISKVIHKQHEHRNVSYSVCVRFQIQKRFAKNVLLPPEHYDGENSILLSDVPAACSVNICTDSKPWGTFKMCFIARRKVFRYDGPDDRFECIILSFANVCVIKTPESLFVLRPRV